MRRALFGASAVALALVSACSARGVRAPQVGAVGTAPTLEELRNATYRGFEGESEEITLTGGSWEGAPYVEGGAARPRLTFVRDFRILADLDGDGVDEAVVLLAQHGGGTGEFLYLAVVDRVGNDVRNIGTARIGDRVEIRGARSEGERIVLDVVQAGPGDAMCCPGELATRAWELGATGLEEVSPLGEPTRLTLDVLSGKEWVLREWSWDEPAAETPAITLRFEKGRFEGSAGCNRYFIDVSPGSAPGDLSVGPGGTTRMMCADEVMALEDRFLEELGAVRKFGFMVTLLSLSYERHGAWNTMLFEGRDLSEEPTSAAP